MCIKVEEASDVKTIEFQRKTFSPPTAIPYHFYYHKNTSDSAHLITMHFSTSTIIAAAAYFSAALAAPVTDGDVSTSHGTPKISSVVNHLDSNNQIDWITAPSGGRYATVPASKIAAPHDALNSHSLNIEARGGHGAAVGGFTNAGQVLRYAASYACEKSGEYGVSSTIEAGATDACDNLLALVPGAPQANAAWNIYQAASEPDDAGGAFSTVYRMFYNTASAPTMTKQICTSVYQKLTSDFCQGKGHNGANTRGGEMKIGSGDDYLMIGMDPNKA